MSEDVQDQDFIAAPAPNEAVLSKPPRARVSDAVYEETPREMMERKRDYLDGFLQEKPKTGSPGEPGGALYEAVVEALKGIYDPEIPVNIYDLGLIYGVEADRRWRCRGDDDADHAALSGRRIDAGRSRADRRLGPRACAMPRCRWVWDPPWGPRQDD